MITAPTLAISPEKVCFFIAKAREFDVKDVVTDPDSGSNPTDDAMIAVLEDHRDDPTGEELRSFIDALTEDEQVDLVALAWLGLAEAMVRLRNGMNCARRPIACTTDAPRRISSASRCWPTNLRRAFRYLAAPARTTCLGNSGGSHRVPVHIVSDAGDSAMETPVQIDFQGMDASEDVRGTINAHIAELEQRFGRVTAGRIVLKAPSGHHRTGGQYEVNIRLALPDGREVNVSRTAKADERHADLSFAINDAFHRARRRLQDHVRRMQGQTKTHVEAPLGTISQIEPIDGFGFLKTTDGREIYFHQNSVLNDAFAALKIGTRVTFSEESGEKGPQASSVKILGKHGLR